MVATSKHDRDGRVDEAAQRYIDAIAPGNRPLFDRLHRLILTAYPEANVVISYRIPTYKVGGRSLHVGAWKHGLSVYGSARGQDGGFTARYPDLKTSKGTVQLRPGGAAGLPAAALRAL